MAVHAAELDLVAFSDATLPDDLFEGPAGWTVSITGTCELLDHYEQVHVIGVLGRYPELDLHVACQLGVLVKGDAKGRVAALRRVVDDLSLSSPIGGSGSRLGVQVELLVLGAGQGELVLKTHRVLVPGLADLQPDPRRILPAVLHALEIMIEEFLLVREAIFTVKALPFPAAVGIKPLVLGGDPPVNLEGAPGVKALIRPAGADQGRNCDEVKPGIIQHHFLVSNRVHGSGPDLRGLIGRQLLQACLERSQTSCEVCFRNAAPKHDIPVAV